MAGGCRQITAAGRKSARRLIERRPVASYRRKLSNRHDATITVKSLGRVSAHNWRLADRNRCVDAVSWQPLSLASAGRPVVCLDLVPQQKVAVRQHRGDMRTFARAWGRSRSGFSGIFEIVAADEAGWWAEKRTPPARRTSIAAPSLALRHPWPPDLRSPPYLPKGAKGPGNDAQPSCGSQGFSEPRGTSSSATASYSISVPVFGMTTPVLSVGDERR